MRQYFFPFLLIVVFAGTLQAQMYLFSQKSETYTALTDPEIIVGDGEDEWWDAYDIYDVPLPFTFNFFGQDFTTLYVTGSGFATFTYEQVEFQGDMIDVLSGFEMSVHDAYHLGSDHYSSSIGYITEGDVGDRIFKLQWENAHFEYDYTEWDYANFQLWLYEEDQKVEFHYGEIEAEPSSYEPGASGPIVSILNETGSDGYILTGNPSNPTANHPPSSASTLFLTGSPTDGAVYVFTINPNPVTSLVSNEIEELIQVFPNPFQENIYIETPKNILIQKTNMYSSNGQLVISASGDLEKMHTETLPPGLYILEIVTNEGVTRRSLVK